jgi:alkaline phosphatase D
VTISRRAFLAGLLATAACSSSNSDGGIGLTSTTGGTGPGVTPPEPPPVDLAGDPFTLGVASGDPDERSVVLWTRLAPDPLVAGAGLPDADVEVAWDLATDESFGSLVAAGLAPAVAALGHSLHVVADALQPASTYWYRFRVGGFTSAVGRTRTAPAPDDAASVALAVASCQKYDHGWYVAHRDIAAADVDLVVFLGDYVYESPAVADAARPIPGPGGGVEDLDGYRRRYAAARLDPDLAACHARHPWVVTWDDHEVQQNYAADVGTGLVRRAEAYQAWYEHMPVRVAPPDGSSLDIHRAVRWGSTLELLVLDTRQFRSAQGCGGGLEEASCADLVDGSRTMLGEAQEAWLAERLAASSVAWATLAQQVVFSPMEVLGRVNLDSWDGYPQARDRVVAALASSPARNAVVLSGDVHAELVADVPQGAATVATELVTSSISSRFASSIGDAFDLLPFAAINARHAASGNRGWLRCDVEPARWRARYRRVVDVTDPESAVEDGPLFEILDGVPGAHEV